MIAKIYRIDKNLIDYILKKGESGTSKLFIIKYIKNSKNSFRYRTIVSTKMDRRATARNKIKRRIYEGVRAAEKELGSSTTQNNLDIVLIPKKSIIKAKFEDIAADIKKLLLNHGRN